SRRRAGASSARAAAALLSSRTRPDTTLQDTMQRFVLSFLAALPFVGAPPAQHQDIKPGPWQKRHAPEGWIIHETPHYQVQSQCGLEKAERLGRHMEAMLKVYTKLFPTDRSLKQ